MTAMFDQQYLARAMEMTKTGNQFFWEPINTWHFAAQREHKMERYTKTIFEARPVFFETRIEIWPTDFKVTAARFKQPWPNLIMLYHGDMCVWSRGVAKPKDAQGIVQKDGVVKIEFAAFMTEAIITIQGIDRELCETLRRNWQARSPRLH